MPRTVTLAVLVGLVACSANVPPWSAVGLTTGNGTNTVPDAGTSDGGVLFDGGVASCPDTDGTQGPNSLVMSQLVFGPQPRVELLNNTTTSQMLSQFSIDGLDAGVAFPTVGIAAGSRVDVELSLPENLGELALFDKSTMKMVQYVCWSQGQLQISPLQQQATQAGLWFSAGACVQVPPAGDSIHLIGAGTSVNDYSDSPETLDGCPLGGDQ